MKMLFFSADGSEVESASKAFNNAGIPCEVRTGTASAQDPPEAELWIRHDRDCHKALMLCVQLGLGFARRSARKSFIDSWSEISTGSAPSPDDLDRQIEDSNGQVEEQVHPFERSRRSKVAGS